MIFDHRNHTKATSGNSAFQILPSRPVNAASLTALPSPQTRGGWRSYPLNQGETLYRAGTAVDTVYLVHSGCIKVCGVDMDCTPVLRRFLLAGDAFGLGNPSQAFHLDQATAASASRVTAIPISELGPVKPLALDAFGLGLEFSADYCTSDSTLALARFLLRLLARNHQSRNMSLPMSWSDIGLFLKLSPLRLAEALRLLEQQQLIRQVHGGVEIPSRQSLLLKACPASTSQMRMAA